MFLFRKQIHYIGIEFSVSLIRIAVLSRTRKGWKVVQLKELPKQKPVEILSQEGIVISALPSRETLVRSCSIPLKKEKDILSALDFQVEPLLPYPSEKAIVQAEPIEKRGDKTILTIFAARKDHLHSHLEALYQHGVEPEQITSTPSALAALCSLVPYAPPTYLIVHLGESEVTCVLIDQGKLLTARAFDHKGSIEVEIQKTILSFSSSYKTKSIETILLVGDPSQAAVIQKTTSKAVIPFSLPSFNLSEEECCRFALPIGMALSGKGPNFRQKAFIYPHRWRWVKKPLIAFFTLSALLTLSLFGMGQLTINQMQKKIQNEFNALPKSETYHLKSTPFAYLTALNEIEGFVQSKSNTYPLLPLVPKVNELLLWLSVLPDSIKIESFRYNMVKRPTISRPKEHYKVRVELELTAKDSQTASSFHGHLTSPNLFVDPKEEIEWSASKGKYRAVFYLKDKTRYN
ncbi:MAG: hypothetical protein WAM28_00970 [Chlamydiales bacterium]